MWLEFDGNNTAYIRGLKGDPSEYLANRQLNPWSLSYSAWHWTADRWVTLQAYEISSTSLTVTAGLALAWLAAAALRSRGANRA